MIPTILSDGVLELGYEGIVKRMLEWGKWITARRATRARGGFVAMVWTGRSVLSSIVSGDVVTWR